MINNLKNIWKLLWKHYVIEPNVRVGESGWASINGYMVFMERVK